MQFLEPLAVDHIRFPSRDVLHVWCAKLSWELKRLQTLWFDDVA